MAAVLPGGVPGQANDNASAAVRLFTAGLPFSEAPKWYYQDLRGELQVGMASSLLLPACPAVQDQMWLGHALFCSSPRPTAAATAQHTLTTPCQPPRSLLLLQGPFDANTMSRWCGENALPKDLRCLGVHPQDANLVPGSPAINHFQPLQKLLENTAAGIQYMPVRLGKGSYSDEGPATPQSAQPPKGSRAPGAGPGGLGSNAQGVVPAGAPLNGGPDVTRAVDQRSALAAAAAAAAGGGLNGFPAQQAAAGGLQGHPLMAHLAQMQAARPGSQPRQPQQQPQQQGTPGRRPTPQPGAPPNQFMHEQAAGGMQQFGAPGGPAGGAGGDGESGEAGELTPNDADWEPALLKLIKREGFVGKEADVKWRVILASGVCFDTFWEAFLGVAKFSNPGGLRVLRGTNSHAGERPARAVGKQYVVRWPVLVFALSTASCLPACTPDRSLPACLLCLPPLPHR
jgi:hypothetical protein